MLKVDVALRKKKDKKLMHMHIVTVYVASCRELKDEEDDHW